ncbi:glutaminyl-peptide cyclotransferase isoform X1 [Selaginella moellendorffii]|uniref:glutaminyl-peptide cyclotransferase isoform X1 n=1 Tax=Selaginella moellendorffii TaxID=88036 RepID=UPI000D1C2C52|nr:glutaminyl-peptide cyclotransferase isoform X1 [Selaginella moellendorffii]XP_024526097.1 glutaminyl-peptide cyclotransferase isoform X1 [Selaginella moellendorffii]XP_024526098.1 glutaminyl-peptide cyclotransferase isoform X1 [Selaginella moellendorffii]|eukprot:XP_024526096.1 glutaminyl-peptide cyclotransferase isoform X1 [Selaginella moellendorffii]
MIQEMGKRRHRLSLGGVIFSAGAVVALVVVLLEVSSASKPKKATSTRQVPINSGFRIVREYPHDAKAFTQGLLYHGNNTLYESTGLHGESSVREVDLQTGEVRRIYRLQSRDFGEGLALWENKFLQVTWQTNKGYIYDEKTLSLLGTFKHPMTDGWGLTHDNKHIIGSDGSSTLYFLDPHSFSEIRRITVKDNGEAVELLNELEYVKGEIWANVWQMNSIARISPKDGRVVGWIVLDALRKNLISAGNRNIDVLNGIAWDEEQDRLFVTGKWWPKLYEIVLSPELY